MQLTNSGDRCFVEPKPGPTNNLNIAYLAISSNVNSDVDCSFSFSSSRALRVFRSQSPVWPRKANALHFGRLFVFRCFLDYCFRGSGQNGTLNSFVFVTLFYHADKTSSQSVIREVL